MTTRQILLRWLPTFFAFPLAGLIASLALGPIDNPLEAAIAGADVGALLGLAQWWALRPLHISFDWFWSSAVAGMVGSPIAWTFVSYSTSIESLAIWGLVAGAVVGCGQALSQRLKLKKTLFWTSLVSATWGLAWFVSASVIVDAEANYAVFGSTGAIVATTLLAFFVNLLFSKKSQRY